MLKNTEPKRKMAFTSRVTELIAENKIREAEILLYSFTNKVWDETDLTTNIRKIYWYAPFGSTFRAPRYLRDVDAAISLLINADVPTDRASSTIIKDALIAVSEKSGLIWFSSLNKRLAREIINQFLLATDEFTEFGDAQDPNAENTVFRKVK